MTLKIRALHSVLAAALAAGAVGSAPAGAQGAAAVAGCSVVTDPAERIACLEAALLAQEEAGEEAPAPAAAAPPSATAPAAEAALPPTAAAAAAAPEAASAAPEAAEASRRGLRLPGVPFLGGRSSESAPAAPLLASDTIEAREMGAEQVAARGGAGASVSSSVPRMAAAVVSSEVVPYKRLQVELDNGQVWRQIESDSPWNQARYGDPQSVEIWPSRTGGYRMLLVEQNVRLRVERVR